LAPRVHCLRTMRALLAEDDPAMRTLLARGLRKSGFEVFEARTGSEALERLANAPVRFDLVISDVRMPGPGGLDLLALLRHADSRVPVILITAFGSAATHAAAERLGAFAMLDKPFDLDDLMTLALSAARSLEGGSPGGSP
jgi:DNA-binding NtrC family response regulator